MYELFGKSSQPAQRDDIHLQNWAAMSRLYSHPSSALVVLITAATLFAARSGIAGDELPAQEVLKRMTVNNTVSEASLTAEYIVRVFNIKSREEAAKNLAASKEGYRKAMETRKKYILAQGGRINEEVLDSELQGNYKASEAHYGTVEDVSTTLERYYIHRGRLRKEKQRLSNSEPLDALKASIIAGQIQFRMESADIVEGGAIASTKYAYGTDGSAETPVTVIVPGSSYASPEVLKMGRDLTDASVFDQIKKSGFDLKAKESKSDAGEPFILLTVGVKNSVKIYSEIEVLPRRGYFTRRSQVSQAGQLVQRTECDDIRVTGSGSWYAGRVLSENYAPDNQGVLHLAQRTEALAVKFPETNAEIDENVFAIDPKARVTDMRVAKTINESSPLPIHVPGLPLQRRSFTWATIAQVIGLCAFVLIVLWRRRRHPSS